MNSTRASGSSSTRSVRDGLRARTGLAFAATAMHLYNATRRDRLPSCHCGAATTPESRHIGGRGYVPSRICTNPHCAFWEENIYKENTGKEEATNNGAGHE